MRDFCTLTAQWWGIDVEWRGSGEQEQGVDPNTGQVLFEVHPSLYRPAEVNTLLGDYTKAATVLGWRPTTDLAALVADMCQSDAAILGIVR